MGNILVWIFESNQTFQRSTNPPQPTNTPPTSINKEMALGIQNATKMYITHGVGFQRLDEISKASGDRETLVYRWQRMMEAFLGTQVHVIAGLGYSADESGLGKNLKIIDFLFAKWYSSH